MSKQPAAPRPNRRFSVRLKVPGAPANPKIFEARNAETALARYREELHIPDHAPLAVREVRQRAR